VKRIKLLLISQATGGVKRHVTLLAGGLDPARFEVVGCFPPTDHVEGVNPHKESFKEAFRALGLRTISVEMYRDLHPIGDLLSFFKLYRVCRQEPWDIVHTHSSKAGFLGRLAATLAGVPVILHTPNAFAFDHPKHHIRNFFYKMLERIAGNFCDALIAVSPSEEELAKEAHLIPHEKIVQISNGIDPTQMACPTEPQVKKRDLGIPDQYSVVLTIGRFAPQKAPEMLIETAKRVVARKQDVAFVMIGDGPLFQEVQKQVHREGLEKNFFLLDWRDDVRDILALCDVYVLTSLWEGLPYTVLEAMSLEKPVVATTARGTRDVVQDGMTGFLVELYNPENMSEKILTLLRDPSLADRMGKEGRLRLEKEFTLQSHLQATRALYERLLRQKGKI